MKINFPIITVIFICAVSFWCPPAQALKFNEDKLQIMNGSDPELAADEGYLFLVLETSDFFSTLVLDRVGKGKRLKFARVGPGGHYALIKLKAGKYYWKTLKSYFASMISFNFDEDDFVFDVKPGVVNYPGAWLLDLKFKSNNQVRLSFMTENKTSFDWIYFKRNYQKFVESTPFVFTGRADDQYVKFIEATKDKYNYHTESKLFYESKEQQNMPINFYHIDQGVDKQMEQFPKLQDYFAREGQASGEISPMGQWVLFNSKQKERSLIEVVDIKSMKSFVVFNEELPPLVRVSNLQWIDNDSFLYDLDSDSYSITHVVHLDFDSSNQIKSAELFKFPISGSVLDPLIKQDNKLLFANYSFTAAKGKLNGLYEVDTSSKKSLKKSFKKKYSKTKQFKQVVQWLSDPQGDVRSVIEAEYDKKSEELYYHHWFLINKNSKKWDKISTSLQSDEVPFPVMLSKDEGYFLAITNNYGDKQSIHKYSTKDYSYVGPFFEDPNVDIVSLIREPTSQHLIGYRYIDNGTFKAQFFEANDDRIKSLREQNPEQQLFVRQYLPDHGLMLLFGMTTFSKGTWYLYHENEAQIIKLMDENPEYEKLPKGDNHSIKVVAKDGVEVEAYLVLPSIKSEQKTPLVVIPHGGPIGVRDYAGNDDMQHFFAANGIATLKVNYRGSGGFGKEFEALGNQQWGEKIEQDIHAVVLTAIENYDLDIKKVCALGGSYGGYSAVMLTYLYPEVYQCAVSLAGVMDLPLMFTNDSLFKDDAFFDKLTEIIGDPKTDLNRLMNKSPFYLAEKLTKPIKLFHGLLDKRVTLEHSLRMQQMFTILGMDGELTLLENEAHSMKHLNSNIFFVAESLKFIIQQLDLPIELLPETEEVTVPEEENSVLDYILD